MGVESKYFALHTFAPIRIQEMQRHKTGQMQTGTRNIYQKNQFLILNDKLVATRSDPIALANRRTRLTSGSRMIYD